MKYATLILCRVSDYGFSKLIELFESIPHMVQITEDPDGERLIQLTDSVRLQVRSVYPMC